MVSVLSAFLAALFVDLQSGKNDDQAVSASSPTVFLQRTNDEQGKEKETRFLAIFSPIVGSAPTLNPMEGEHHDIKNSRRCLHKRLHAITTSN